jgi:hypothetical protein
MPNHQVMHEFLIDDVIDLANTIEIGEQIHVLRNSFARPRHNELCPRADNTVAIPVQFPAWRPSTKLLKLCNEFQNTILFQAPVIPCAYCSKMMYMSKVKWLPYNAAFTYPLTTANEGKLYYYYCYYYCDFYPFIFIFFIIIIIIITTIITAMILPFPSFFLVLIFFF